MTALVKGNEDSEFSSQSNMCQSNPNGVGTGKEGCAGFPTADGVEDKVRGRWS